MQLDYYSFSSCGGRENNEDAVAAKEFQNGGRFALADGLGGHRLSEYASEAVAAILTQMGKVPIMDRMAIAHEHVIKLQREQHANMRSTAVVLDIAGNRADWAHVGDSRLYFIRQGRLESYTEDHSVAYKNYKAGMISRNQIGSDENQSKLLKVLGGKEIPMPDAGYADGLLPGDGFMLCSDGIWAYLTDDEILIDHLKASSARSWAELLLIRVMDRIKPGNDNMSIITVLLK